MSIEKDLTMINDHLERIATSLEALLAERGYVPTGPTTVDNDDKLAAGKKKTNKKSKKKSKTTVVGKKKDKDDAVVDVKEVRKALTLLQESLGQSHVKSLLKKYGASTLGQLDESKYQRVIDDAMEDVEEDE